MAFKVKPVAHDEQLSVIGHLEELRLRLIIATLTFCIAFAISVWQSDLVLKALNRPLANASVLGKAKHPPKSPNDPATAQLRVALERTATVVDQLAQRDSAANNVPKAQQAKLRASVDELRGAIRDLEQTSPQRQPLTLGVSEPLLTTLNVSFYFALLLSLPLLLYQLYAFVLPALTKRERRVALPLMASVPVLFLAGVLFGYFIVLPSALSFLQNFNASAFNIFVQAKDYYRFVIMGLLALGVLFQIPAAMLAASRLGIITAAKLRGARRYAILVLAILAMLLPGTDPVTMLLALAVLVALYEGSILLVAAVDRISSAKRST
jgi:sec-independent protein translocase protein TatC